MTDSTDSTNQKPAFAYLKPFHPVSDDMPASSYRLNLDYVERVLHFMVLLVLMVFSFFSAALYIPVFLIGYGIGKMLNPMIILVFWIILGIIAAPAFLSPESVPNADLQWLMFYTAMCILTTLCGMRYKETHYRRYVYLPVVLWLIIFWFGRFTDVILPIMRN